MMMLPGSGKRTRALGLAVLAVTFLVGGLSGLAVQQARRGAQPAPTVDDGVLRLPDASGNLRPCPPPRLRFEPLDSIGATAVQKDSIENIMAQWQPKLMAAWRAYDEVQDSLFEAYEHRADAVRDSMQVETRAVLSQAQVADLLALYARRDSTRRAVRADLEDFEDRCRDARRGSEGRGRRADTASETGAADASTAAAGDAREDDDDGRDKQH